MISLRALILSLLVHLLLMLLMQHYQGSYTPPHSDVVEIDVRPEVATEEKHKPEIQKNFTRYAEPPKQLLEENNEEAKYLSLQRQRVKQEQVAHNSGLTENRAQQAREQQQQQQSTANLLRTKPAPEKLNRPALDVTTDGDIGVKHKVKEQNKAQASVSKPLLLPQGVSSFGGHEEKIKVGDFTALNTDRHLFYTFYSRIEERIRHRWESRVVGVMQEQEQHGAGRKLYERDWVSIVEIILDAKGEFQRVVIDRKSGIDGLESAVITAFKEGAPFLNPPQEIVRDDGLIHLRYSFVVRWGNANL